VNSEIVIKITAQGAGQPIEASLQGDSGTLPVPDRNSEAPGRSAAVSAGNVPSPSDSFGSASTASGQVPSPEQSQSQIVDALGGDHPQPVAPGEIENLGSGTSSAKSRVETSGPPIPEPE
jgi:hypothetical protein